MTELCQAYSKLTLAKPAGQEDHLPQLQLVPPDPGPEAPNCQIGLKRIIVIFYPSQLFEMMLLLGIGAVLGRQPLPPVACRLL